MAKTLRKVLRACLVTVVFITAGSAVHAAEASDGYREETVVREKGTLEQLIAKTPVGSGEGEIDPEAPRGFAAIPGAPDINYAVAFLWAVWIGWIFSTVGAFGGIMAGVGHLTIFGLGDYADSFRVTNPELNALLTDTIRASNQYLVGLAALISTISFYRMKRLVVPLGIILGAGSVTAGLLVPVLTAGKLQSAAYIGYFGLTVLLIGAFIFYSTTGKGQAERKHARERAASFRQKLHRTDDASKGVRVLTAGVSEVSFSFYGERYRFNPLLTFTGGFLIAALSSFIGVGGGFLYVPFLMVFFRMPMFLVAGTSALVVMVSMLTSIFSYVVIKHTFISWELVGVEMIGVLAGAAIGPVTQKYIPELWLKRIFVALALYVGIRYFSTGFFGQSWLPPF